MLVRIRLDEQVAPAVRKRQPAGMSCRNRGRREDPRAGRIGSTRIPAEMRYVRRVLQPGETVVYETKVHWWIYFHAIWLLFTAVVLVAISVGIRPEMSLALRIGAALLVLIALPTWLRAFIRRATTELAVTSRRVIHKEGLFRRNTFEMNLSQVESVGVNQSILGRIFGFGELSIFGSGAHRQAIPIISDPLTFRSHITAA